MLQLAATTRTVNVIDFGSEGSQVVELTNSRLGEVAGREIAITF
jgi:hypothetical protein